MLCCFFKRGCLFDIYMWLKILYSSWTSLKWIGISTQFLSWQINLHLSIFQFYLFHPLFVYAIVFAIFFLSIDIFIFYYGLWLLLFNISSLLTFHFRLYYDLDWCQRIYFNGWLASSPERVLAQMLTGAFNSCSLTGSGSSWSGLIPFRFL